jgi:hypothetical protein
MSSLNFKQEEVKNLVTEAKVVIENHNQIIAQELKKETWFSSIIVIAIMIAFALLVLMLCIEGIKLLMITFPLNKESLASPLSPSFLLIIIGLLSILPFFGCLVVRRQESIKTRFLNVYKEKNKDYLQAIEFFESLDKILSQYIRHNKFNISSIEIF